MVDSRLHVVAAAWVAAYYGVDDIRFLDRGKINMVEERAKVAAQQFLAMFDAAQRLPVPARERHRG